MAAQHQTVLGTLVLMTCSGIVGYWIGVGRSLGITRGTGVEETDADVSEKPSAPAASSKSSSSSSGSDVDLTDGDHIGDIAQVKAGLLDDCKLILVVRTDLGMTKGKIAAQCGHATLACYKALQKDNPTLLKHWERTGQAKIAVKADSEDELLVLQAQAQSLNICAKSIQDAGRTQIAAGSRTVLGIGPAPTKLINQVTGSLKLL